jgi:membrane-bound metal-dependent hydrolase YbcI (DUF457 family)
LKILEDMFMEGHGHMILGAATFMAVGPTTLNAVGDHLTVAQTLAGCVLAAGASILPDLDCPAANVSRSLGPITENLSHFVAKVSGGHRHGTHTVAATAGVGLLTGLLFLSPWAHHMGELLAFFLTALVCRVIFHDRGLYCAIVGAISAVAMQHLAPIGTWAVGVITLGYFTHLLGDIITKEGLWPLAPFSHQHMGIHLIGHVGDWREHAIASIAALIWAGLTLNLIFS